MPLTGHTMRLNVNMSLEVPPPHRTFDLTWPGNPQKEGIILNFERLREKFKKKDIWVTIKVKVK